MSAHSYLSITLCCKADNRTQQASRQDDLEIIAVAIQFRHSETERHPHRQTHCNAQPEIIELLSKESCRDARNQPLECRADDDAAQLVADLRREPGREPIKNSKDRAQRQSQ